MSAAEIYEASPIKRHRSTKAEMEARAAALFEIVKAMKPMTVRQVFYQASVKGIVEKTEAGYDAVQRLLVTMRRSGDMSYGWLTDSTRWQRKPTTYSSPAEALRETAKFYRKSLWNDLNEYVEVWLEKDALAGVIYPITELYDVPLMVARGYASLSFLADAADYINDLADDGKKTFIYHFGDFDPSGVNAAEKIRDTLNEMAPDAEIHFERVAVTEDQIRHFHLPSRPTKSTDTRSKNFSTISVELDALPPSSLRRLVQMRLEDHLPKRELDVLLAAEKSEREMMMAWAGQVEADGDGR